MAAKLLTVENTQFIRSPNQRGLSNKTAEWSL
ncbi:MAG: hypothetical protein FD173_1857 [Gallionellaceae bacterium]|nr:MAG: hypothetical protein FD173_1857 [Gallionellaceae bacterium]